MSHFVNPGSCDLRCFPEIYRVRENPGVFPAGFLAGPEVFLDFPVVGKTRKNSLPGFQYRAILVSIHQQLTYQADVALSNCQSSSVLLTSFQRGQKSRWKRPLQATPQSLQKTYLHRLDGLSFDFKHFVKRHSSSVQYSLVAYNSFAISPLLNKT